MVLYGVVPECHRSVSGMVSECIKSAKMVSLSASGTVNTQEAVAASQNDRDVKQKPNQTKNSCQTLTLWVFKNICK